jgi:hypothetical protein
MHYKIQVTKIPPNYNGGRKTNATFISGRGIFCTPKRAGLFTKDSALKWIERYTENKSDDFAFELINAESVKKKIEQIRGELLPF